MKVLWAALLAGVACMELAGSLQCYTCREPTDLSACTAISNCSEKETACKTTVLSVDSASGGLCPTLPLRNPDGEVQIQIYGRRSKVYLILTWGYPFFGNITVTNSCAETCVPSDPDGIGESHPNSCCYTDLCNTGRGPGLRASYGTMGITAATLWTVLRVTP